MGITNKIIEFNTRNLSFDQNITKDVVDSKISNNRNIVSFNMLKQDEIDMFLSYYIISSERKLFIDILVIDDVTSRYKFNNVLGIIANIALNSGIRKISFLVHQENIRMLNICKRINAKELKCNLTNYKEFEVTTSSYSEQFKNHYHRFLLGIDNQALFNVTCIKGEYILSDRYKSNSTKYDILGNSNDDIYLYLKEYDKSIHGNSESINEIYSGDKDIIEKFETYFNNVFDKDPEISQSLVDKSYLPINMFILPTNKCNLGCKYCYSEATPHKQDLLSLDYAKNAIDFLFSNANDTNSPVVNITFHGGGEPLCAKDLVFDCIKYAEKLSEETKVKVEFSMSTNATLLHTLDKSQLEKFSSMQLSIDGTKEVQNLHRPYSTGKESFSQVLKNIKLLTNDFPKIDISIRSTVSAQSMGEMSSIVEFFADFGIKSIVFEPLFMAGRAFENLDISPPDMSDFMFFFSEANQLAHNLGIEVKNSGSYLYRDCSFCGATDSNFAITPTGEITTCVEVSNKQDSLSPLFFIGNCKQDTVIDKVRLTQIRKRGLQENIECQYCIAQKSCRGGCLTRMIKNHENFNEFRIQLPCLMQTSMFVENILDYHSAAERIN